MINDEVQKAVAQLNKRFGSGTVMRLNERPGEIPAISTGSLAVDRITGIGGIPRGRITEIYGPEGAGKTTLAQHIAAEAQKGGGSALYIDVENAIDPSYMVRCGVNTEELLLSQPSSGTEAFDIIMAMLGKADLIIVDSVAHLVHPRELGSDADSENPGILARLMSSNLKRVVSKIGLTNTALVFLNQIRMKIGVGRYEDPETQPGGRALKFDASLRMVIRKSTFIKEKDQNVGHICRCRVEKNKLAPPFMVGTFDLYYGKGIDRVLDVLTVAKAGGVVGLKGPYYYYAGESIGQGSNAARAWLAEHPDKLEEIRAAVLARQPTIGADSEVSEEEPSWMVSEESGE